ncbi:MAG: hypothetical protein PHV49_02560 [Alistipes sp.]|nr:hypothetical protein [Alistipes sp.]
MMLHRIRFTLLTLAGCVGCVALSAQLRVTGANTYGIALDMEGETRLASLPEGLWAIATAWEQNWMTDWVYGAPTQKEQSGAWTVLRGELQVPGKGAFQIRDAYTPVREGLVQCVRRFRWMGVDTLRHVTLSVRFRVEGSSLKPFCPGILYYGNPAGAKVDAQRIPVYEGQAGDFALFEEHRYPMPFVMAENSLQHYAATLHTVPSPVQGAKRSDQWWSMGIEAKEGYSELVLYSGPVGYNHQHSVVKALQHRAMSYPDTDLEIAPGQVIEKEFYLEVSSVPTPGSGFQTPVHTSIALNHPQSAEAFPSFEQIVRSKYRFALTRWIDQDSVAGFNMYDPSLQSHIVMGWCGQADSPGFALQWLGASMEDSMVVSRVQRSLDFLCGAPIDSTGLFRVDYNVQQGVWSGGDPVSCGQAMYNFAKAIEMGRRSRLYDTRRWEAFLRQACEGQAQRILRADWNPHSTAEGFLIAPLAIAAKLFKNSTYKKAAIKAGETFAARHLSMEEPYWGGTLDATCEDKEGAWAAFQGFLELYERFHEPRFFAYARHAMDVCLSYVVVWNIPLPAGRLADHHFRSEGWTVVSPQNQHLDVYGVLFAPEIYKMGRYTEDSQLMELSRLMYRTCFQLTDPMGSQGEQIQHTNFAQHGDMSRVERLRGGYSESWTVFWITAHFLNAAARFAEMGVVP